MHNKHIKFKCPKCNDPICEFSLMKKWGSHYHSSFLGCNRTGDNPYHVSEIKLELHEDGAVTAKDLRNGEYLDIAINNIGERMAIEEIDKLIDDLEECQRNYKSAVDSFLGPGDVIIGDIEDKWLLAFNKKKKLKEAIKQYVSKQREEAFDKGYINGAKVVKHEKDYQLSCFRCDKEAILTTRLCIMCQERGQK